MAYWLSHALHDGSYSLANPNHLFPTMTIGCIVSIVLDDGAHLQFSAIHLSIVSRDPNGLNNLNIFESFDPGRHIRSDLVSSATYRSRLGQRAAIQKDRLTAQATSDASICTVVFEVVKTPDNNNDDIIALVPLPRSTEPSNLRLVYHRIQPCDTANPALLVFLGSNFEFSLIPNNLWTATFFPVGVPVHSVRIIPLVTHRKVLPLTQPLIVLRIVNFAIGEKPLGWRKALLNYALTSKSWAHVLSLFYERFDGTFEWGRPDVTTVARSLKAKPEYGQLMSTLQYSDYDFESALGEFAGHWHLKGWYAFLDVIQYATSVTVVSLPSIPGLLVGQLAFVLSNLLKVRKCYISKNNGSLSMANIQRFITNWKELQKLEVHNWMDQPNVKTASNYLGCNIEELALRIGTIRGPQLLRFASPTGCRLTQIVFEHVHGISNHDFYLFLSAAAATLVVIHIYESPMLRLSPDEELALDAAIPMMKNLERLEASHVSVLALSRKLTVARDPGVKKFSSIVVSPVGENMSLQQVTAAMEVTGWDSISLIWQGPSDWDMDLAKTVANGALKRGIKLSCYPS